MTDIVGTSGNDTLNGTGDADTIIGGAGNDRILPGQGADSVEAGTGNDTILLSNSFGNDTIFGGDGSDVLDLTASASGVTVSLCSPVAGAGTVTDGTSTASLHQIEEIVLSGGNNTIELGSNAGTITLSGYTAPVLNPDGTYTLRDLFILCNMFNAAGLPVTAEDIEVTDTNGDGTGVVVIVFPGTTRVIVPGLPVAIVEDPEIAVKLGFSVRDFIVEGTDVGELIDIAYTGDPHGDMVDMVPSYDGDTGDYILAKGGNDTIQSGLGSDIVYAGEGNDSVEAGEGDDTVYGADGLDELILGQGADLAYGGEGVDGLYGEQGDDTLYGDAGNDAIYAGLDNDLVYGGDGDDFVNALDGEDVVYGGGRRR